jgi:hypothetical protein
MLTPLASVAEYGLAKQGNEKPEFRGVSGQLTVSFLYLDSATTDCLRTKAVLEDSMRYRQFFILMLFVSFPFLATAQTKAPLKLVATIPLPGLKDGDFDHFAPDIDGHRLFLTDEENDKVDVLDTATNTRIEGS